MQTVINTINMRHCNCFPADMSTARHSRSRARKLYRARCRAHLEITWPEHNATINKHSSPRCIFNLILEVAGT